MNFLLKSEVEVLDPTNKYVIKRIFCPYCRKFQVKKISKSINYTKYQCWNKNCFGENDRVFYVLQEYIEKEENIKKGCELCGEKFFRTTFNKSNDQINLVFKCINPECENYNYENIYDVSKKSWIKKDVLSKIEFQYLVWYLYRHPSLKEFEIIDSFLLKKDFILVSEEPEKEAFNYRKFLKNNTSIHVKLSIKSWGFGINFHRDIKVHSEVKFDNQTLRIASELYLTLKKERYGRCFMLPREKLKFRKFLIYKYQY